MKLLLVLFLTLFFNYPAFSGELEPFLAGGKWGFRDRVTKTIAVSPQFENACAFSEGLACVKSGIGWGYIDETGKMVIPPQKNICRISYPFLSGEALCIFSPLKACERFEKFGGFELFRCIAAPYEGGELSEKQLHRKIDRTGKILYRSTGIKGDGMEVVITPENKFGYAREFKLAIQPKYNFAQKCTENKCGVLVPGKYWGYIDYNDNFVIPPTFGEVGMFSCGLATTRTTKGSYGIINSSGEYVVQPVYDYLPKDLCKDELQARFKAAEGILNKKGWEFTPDCLSKAFNSMGPAGVSEKIDMLSLEELSETCPIPGLTALAASVPNCFNCYMALAAKQSFNARKENIDKAIAIKPADPQPYWLLATMADDPFATEGSEAYFVPGIEAYLKMIELEPTNPSWPTGVCSAGGKAPNLLTPELRSKVLAACDKAIKADPDNVEYQNNKVKFIPKK